MDHRASKRVRFDQPPPGTIHEGSPDYPNQDGQNDNNLYSDSNSASGLKEGITMAMTAHRGKIGCCYFDTNDSKIYTMEDTNDSIVHWDLVSTCAFITFSTPLSTSE